MFFRMIRGAIMRQFKKMFMVAFTITLGVSLATAMLNVMLDVGDKVNQELKTYGANINVVPKGVTLINDVYGLDQMDAQQTTFLKEDEIGRLKTIFWAHNIVDFTPYYETAATLNNHDRVRVTGTWFNKEVPLPSGDAFTTGIIKMKNWWTIDGEWLKDDQENTVMVGSDIKEKYNLAIGDQIKLQIGNEERVFTISTFFTSGSKDDEVIYMPLSVIQEMFNNENKVTRIEVSALTTPDNELSRRAAENPKRLSIKDYETWYCTAYVSSVSFQIDEVLTDAIAKPIRQVAESEGAILNKTKLIMLLITVLSMFGSALAISNLVTASVMERASEIGLLKAVGAKDYSVVLLILTEILVIALIGASFGYFIGLGFAQIIGQTVFSSSISIKPVVIPIVSLLVALVTFTGSLPAIRLLLSLRPAEVLHGR